MRFAITEMLAAAITSPAVRAETITLHGAIQFNDAHAFNKALLKLEKLVKKYHGKPVNFVLHRNSELGTEKDYLAYLSQGISVDYAIVSPSHMSTFVKTIENEVARRADVMTACWLGQVTIRKTLRDAMVLLVPTLGVLVFAILFPKAILALPRWLMPAFGK